MKKLIGLLTLLIFPLLSLQAQSLSEAEATFAENNFPAAQKQYEQLLPSSTGNEKFQTQLRIAACQYQQGEFLNAAKTMYGYELPADPIWKARFLLYRIHMAQQAPKIYSRNLNQHEIDTPEARADLETWTQAQWDEQIDKDFRQLWQQRNDLIQAPIEQENLILNLKDTDTRRIPTLFDFTVQTWLTYLNNNMEQIKAAPLASAKEIVFLNGTARPQKGRHKQTRLLQAEILEAAYTLAGNNRQNAQVFWQTDFILFPLNYQSDFVFDTKEKAISVAQEQLNTLSGFKAAKPSSWWDRIKNYFADTPPDTSYASGYTAFETAKLLASNKQSPKAAEVCAFAESLPASYFTQQCQNLVQRLSQVSFQLQAPGQTVNREHPQLKFTGKNLHTLFINIYPISFEELQKLYTKHYPQAKISDWNQLFAAPETKDFLSFASKTPLHTLTQQIAYEELAKEQQGEFSLPSLKPGIYVVLGSSGKDFNPKENPVQAVLLNATDLALFATAAIEGDPADFTLLRNQTPKTLSPNVFHLYGINLKTGEPVPNLPIDMIINWDGAREKTQLQASGDTSLKRKISISLHERYQDYRTSLLATHQGSLAYTSSLHFGFRSSDPVLLTVQTDRPIYRPGQKVQIAMEAFERQVRGWKTLGNQKMEITVRDPNWKAIFTTTLSTNELGAAQTSLTLPQEGLLGVYHIQINANTNNRSYGASESFRVEEFKRPDYEVTLNEPHKALEFDKPGQLTGKAAYYFGAPLANAKVSYTLTRENYVPPFYWWWFRTNFSSAEIISQGETTTDANGNFSVSFTPAKSQEKDEFARFTLQTQVYDESGRPIESSRSYNVSAHPHLFKVDFTQGFYDANTQAPLAKIDLTDADGKSITGQIHLKAKRLENKLPTVKEQACNGYYCQERKPSLEEFYSDFSAQNTAFEKTLSFSTAGEQTVELPALPEGVYRLELSSAKASPQQMIFVVVQPDSKLQLPDVALAQHDTYYPSETIRVLLGASDLSGSKRVEIYQAGQFLIHKEKLTGGIHIFEFPVTQTMRGGVGLRWFGASNYRFHQGASSVEIPFDNKKLSVTLDIPETIKPGALANWKVSAKDATGAAVNGQVSATVYDKSLDYYVKRNPSLTFNKLFSQNQGVSAIASSAQSFYIRSLGNPSLKLKDSLHSLPIPTLNLVMQVPGYGRLINQKMLSYSSASAAPRMAMAKGAAAAEEAEMEMARAAKMTKDSSSALGASKQTAEETTDTSSIRTDFAETAYFNAMLPLTNGQARLQFTMPQSLTTWNIFGFIITRLADFGDFTAQTVTRKDFMVRLTMPRFYREGDKGTLQAAITNQTNQKLTAQVSLSIALNKKSALADWGIQQPSKTVTIAPNSTQFVTWEITAPYAPELYQITAVARSGKESDGEQKEIPVLPAKQRLLASAHIALKNGANTLTLSELEKVPAKDVEITSLTLNPSLALSVLNSMPNLLSNPHKDLVSSLNRYVPLAVVNKFYSTYPELKQAVKKLPKRTGLTAPWNENDPLRLELLSSTPWLRQAQGRQVRTADIINLFDDTVVSNLLSKELKTIVKFQNGSGAFTWFAGGPDDEYLTLYALEAFSQALAYQADIPQAAAQRAFTFIYPRIETRLKNDKEGSVGSVAYALYAAYTLSAFPQTWPQYSAAKPYIKRWVDYADQTAKFMTPLGKIYAAAVYHRLGDDVKANRYLDLVLAQMKEDPLTGAYFAPEPQSWMWYNDTLTTQTVTLRTLLEIRPNAPQIDAMTQWLLFNRQVNDWTDSKATTQAVFTLLDVMKTKGALSSPVKYNFQWGTTRQNISFEPLDWTEDLQFVHTGAQITPQDYQVTVHKQGKMTDFASLNAIYRAANVKASPKGVLNVSRQYFRRVKEDTQTKLVPIENLENVHIGDEIEVHLTVHTNSAFEYVRIQDPKPAGFESEELLSNWNWNPVSFYREVRDASTNFFVNWLPNGTVTFRYVLRPTVAGQFHAAAAQAQSMYAPEYGAHTASTVIQVVK